MSISYIINVITINSSKEGGSFIVVKTTYDKINISFCVEQNKVSVLAEHLPKMPTASWEMYNDIGINYDFGEDYVLLSTASKPTGIADRMARLYLFAMWTVIPVGGLKYTFNELFPNYRSELFGNKK